MRGVTGGSIQLHHARGDLRAQFADAHPAGHRGGRATRLHGSEFKLTDFPLPSQAQRFPGQEWLPQSLPLTWAGAVTLTAPGAGRGTQVILGPRSVDNSAL